MGSGTSSASSDRPARDKVSGNWQCNSQKQGFELFEGNLLSRRDCSEATRDTRVVYHLAAGMEKSFAGCFFNSVVTTRNLLEAVAEAGVIRRFVNVSSFAVSSNASLRRHALLDESCALEAEHVRRNEPYAYAKLKQRGDRCRVCGQVRFSLRHPAAWGSLRPRPSTIDRKGGTGDFRDISASWGAQSHSIHSR